MTYSKKYFLNLFLFLALFYKTNAQEQQHHDKEKNGHHANEYMHQSNFDELVKRFESPERDAYQQPEKVLQMIGSIKGKKIMDIGAGSGYFSVKMAQRGAQVIAADVNDEFQEYLNERIKKEKLSSIELRKIAFDNPSLKDKEVDIVLIVNTYHHIDQRPAYFAKVKKGIKDNGEMILIDFFKTDIPVGPPTAHKIAMDDVIAELKLAGFSSFTVDVNLLSYQYIIRAK
jgi:cyclopropane fatty-acyl-phospholipid synthase-like methyltransferase